MYLKNIIVLLLAFSLLGHFPQRIALAELEITQQSYTEQINYFAKLYSVDSSLINKIVECESGGSHNAVGDGGRSKGLAQFQKATFDNLEDKFGDDLDYKSSFDQVKLLTWSVANGYGNNWTAYRAIKNGGRYTFYSSQLKKHFTIYCKL